MSNRDELRQAVARAIVDTAWGIDPWPSLADAAIAAYETHRPRPDVVLTREEWAKAKTQALDVWFSTNARAGYGWSDVMDSALRAAFPWIRVEDE
jgi:hypothetical protein